MEFKDKLISKAKAGGIVLSLKTAEKLALHWQSLIEANKKFNLTAIKDADIAIEKHYVDCLMASQKAKEAFAKSKNIADIGSGGGFPGLIMAVMQPQLEFTLIEASQKKAHFLTDCVFDMKLDNVKVLAIRAEDAGHDPLFREKFDMVVARAVAELSVLVEYGLPLLKPKGVFLALKGPKAEEELIKAQDALAILNGQFSQIIPYDLADTLCDYKLVVVKKTSHTSKKYPRRAGMPEKKPL